MARRKTTTPARRTRVRAALKPQEPRAEKAVSEPKEPTPTRAFSLRNYRILTLLVIIGLLALAYYYKGLFVAATVNGQPIPRLLVVQELERQGGKQTLNALVTRTLIQQEASKRNIAVSQKEVDTEMKKLEEAFKKQGQDLNQQLKSQGMTKELLAEQIRNQKLVEKMIAKDVKVTDKEVDAYIAQNKESLPENTDQKQLRENVKQQLRQQKLNRKFQEWLDDLQKKAKINYFVNY